MPLRFEAWTLPSTGAFTKRFDIPDVLPGASGVVELSTYTDTSFAVPATFPKSKLDQLASDTDGSLVKVFKDSSLIDEFESERVSIPAGRPSIREISGRQRNGLLEGIGIAPKDYPDHKAGAMHWKWGAKNILPELNLDDLGSIREEWEIVLLGERYQLDLSSATAGTFTLTLPGGTTSAIDWDAEASSIRSAIEAVSGITEVSVVETDTDSRAFWIVFESPKDLASNMTADFTLLTGGGTLNKFNDGFDTGANPTFTITVDGQTTSALAWNASANSVEGTATAGIGLQGLSNVSDVTVDGSGTFSDPWAMTFYEPPTIGAFSVTFAAGTHLATLVQDGALDASPITISKPVDAGASTDEDHGDYGTPALTVVTTTPLDTGATWTLFVNANGRYAGSQILLNVTPGETYSDISVPIYPTASGTYTIVLRDIFDGKLKFTTPRDVQLTAGSYQTITIPTFTVPDSIHQLVLRVAVTDPRASVNTSGFYVSWQTATFMEGEPATTFTHITRQLLEAAQDRGVGTWVELDATDAADTLGTVLDNLNYTAFVGDNSNLVNSHLDEGRKLGYQWDLRPADEAQVITPAGTTTHVLQVYYVDADEIEDLATATGPSVTVGSHVSDAQLVTRRWPYTTLIGLGAGSVSAEDVNAAAEAGIGRVERIVDVENLGSVATVQAHLDAQSAEQARNQKALSAKVLESASKLPGIDYGAGSNIWWQFPGIHDKEARPVKRWSWTHGNVAQFEVQGSRVLTKEGAMSSAVDMLLRKPGRRRDDKPIPAPNQLADIGAGHVPTVFIAASNSSDADKLSADFIADGVDDQVTWALAIGALPAPNSLGPQGRVVVAEGDYSFTTTLDLPPEGDARIDFVGLGYPTIHIDFPTITVGAPTRVFKAGTTGEKAHFEFHKLRFIGGTAEIKIIEVPSGDLRVVDCIFEDLTVQACIIPPRVPSQSFEISHCVFRLITISGNEGVASPNGVIWHDFSGGQYNGTIFGNRFATITGAVADFGGAAHIPRVVAIGNVLTGATGKREGTWTHNYIDNTYVPGDHTGLTVDHGGLTGLADDDHTQYLLADGTRAATFIDIAGLTGATSDSRYVGATASGAPASGTFLLGDFVISQDGNIYVCTTAGSPGTWTAVGASAATDAAAIHDNVANEISALTTVTPVAGDWVLVEDASDSFNKKKVDANQFLGGGGGGSVSQVGRTTAGASWLALNIARRYVRQVSLTSGQLVVSIGAYLRETAENVAGFHTVALYTNDAGTPGHLLGVGSGYTVVDSILFDANDERWFYTPLGVYVPATASYWIAFWARDVGTTNLEIANDATGATSGYVTAGGNWWLDKDAVGFGFTSETIDYSMHAVVLG